MAEDRDQSESHGDAAHEGADNRTDDAPASATTRDSGEEREPKDSPLTAEERSQARRHRQEGLQGLAGSIFGGPTSTAGHAAGRDVNIYVGSAGSQSRPEPLPLGPVRQEKVTEVRRLYVTTDSHTRAAETLSTYHLLLLRGNELSGRQTTALRLLDNLAPNNIFSVERHRDIMNLREKDSEPGRGYVLDSLPLERAGQLSERNLDELRTWLQQQNSYLVITMSVETAAVEGDIHDYVIDHSPPDSTEVLRSHVERHDFQKQSRAALWLDDPLLQEEVTRTQYPCDIAWLATSLASAAQDGRPLPTVLAHHRERRIAEQARRLLTSSFNSGSDVDQLYRRTLFIAVCVFDGLPYMQVAAAAEPLFELLSKASLSRGFTRNLFELRRALWLDVAHAQIEQRRSKDLQNEVSIEHVRLRDPTLGPAVLDELWRSYDAARRSLLDWLTHLAVDQGSTIETRVRAAQALGRLAAHDFEYVYDAVIDRWATHGQSQGRHAAAWALEAATHVASGWKARVHRLLADWCQDGDVDLQHTAVLVYGTAVGSDSPEEALGNLRRLGVSGDDGVRQMVGHSTTELFAMDAHAPVIHALSSWATDSDPTARKLAAHSLVPLADLRNDAQRPPLLEWCGHSAAATTQILPVWHAALDEPTIRAETWEALWGWCRASDQSPELLEPLRNLCQGLVSSDGEVGERLDWYLRLWSVREKHQSVTLDKLRAGLTHQG